MNNHTAFLLGGLFAGTLIFMGVILNHYYGWQPLLCTHDAWYFCIGGTP